MMTGHQRFGRRVAGETGEMPGQRPARCCEAPGGPPAEHLSDSVSTSRHGLRRSGTCSSLTSSAECQQAAAVRALHSECSSARAYKEACYTQ